MNPGELRSRIIIEKQSVGYNDFHGHTETWSTHATVWAKVDHLSGRELSLAQQISADISYEFTIRYRSDIANIRKTELFRINYNGKYFNIRDVKDLDNRHTWLYLKCEVRQSEQLN